MRRIGWGGSVVNGNLIHGFLVEVPTRIRAHEPQPSARIAPPETTTDIALSSIRTLTVGPGISPGLLTPPPDQEDGRSRADAIPRHHRRWGLSPRPENACPEFRPGVGTIKRSTRNWQGPAKAGCLRRSIGYVGAGQPGECRR